MKNLSVLLSSLKALDTDQEACQDILGHMFDTCSEIHDYIQDCDLSSNEKEYQETVEACILYLEKCTHMVNELDLFSSNETVEEVQTSSIKYMMIPALLGNLNLLRQSKEHQKRIGFLDIAEVYFKDFLLRCKNYELSKRQLVNDYEDKLLDDESNENCGISQLNSESVHALRENKIQVYRLRKELKTREDNLKPYLERADSEEYIREYYLLVVERWMLTAVEELKNIKSEKACLREMMRRKEECASDFSPSVNSVKPLKPIIITKNEVQKKVFGLGYPSIPVMTIDDFYRQRFASMVEEHKHGAPARSLQASAMMGEPVVKDEAAEKDKLVDNDDPTALQQARAWDNWKDDHPRGIGNRHNKG